MPHAKKQTTQKSKKSATIKKAVNKSVAAPENKVVSTKRLSSAPKLFVISLKILRDNYKTFLGILGIYALANFILVGGVSENGISDAKAAIDQSSVHATTIHKSATLLSAMLSSTGNNADGASGAYQTVLILLMSVILIWTLRQIYAGHRIRIREAYYQGAYPLVPFTLLLMLIGVELLPLIVAGGLYREIVGGGITIGFLEKAVALAVFIALTILSLYFICSSVFALYIVTLPDMTPMRALRTAKNLVRNRRLVLLRKLLFLPLVLFVLGTVILLPVALYLTPAAAFVFFLLSIIALAVVHSYMYALYREML